MDITSGGLARTAFGKPRRAKACSSVERDHALASAIDLSDELTRVRIEAERTRRELSRTCGDSCDTVRAELSTCTSLLERSTELLARGSRLAEQTAIEKDCVTRIYQKES